MKSLETKKSLAIYLLFFTFLILIFLPLLVFGQDGGLVGNDCGTIVDGKLKECGYNDMLALVNRIISWLIMVSIPLSAGVFAWAGFLYMTTGISQKKEEAKQMMKKVLIGFVVILSAWIIVGTIMNTLLNPSSNVNIPIQGVGN